MIYFMSKDKCLVDMLGFYLTIRSSHEIVRYTQTGSRSYVYGAFIPITGSDTGFSWADFTSAILTKILSPVCIMRVGFQTRDVDLVKTIACVRPGKIGVDL